MTSRLERCLIGGFQRLSSNLSASSSSSTSSYPASLLTWKRSNSSQRNDLYMSDGMYYLDEGGHRRKKRNPNDPRRAKVPEGPKLGCELKPYVPWTYGKVKPHYHVFRQLWPEPSLLKRKFGPHVGEAEDIATKRRTQRVEEVVVPPRKSRGPTAVLEALSLTVRLEAGSAPYDLIDDPFLMPTKLVQDFSYRRSKAMGRRAAQRIAEDKSCLFDFEFFRPDPIIDAFESGKADWIHEVEKGAEVGSVIKERIEAGRYDLALQAYQSCSESAQLSPEVLASLFQIAAWQNFSWENDDSLLRPSDSLAPEGQRRDWNIVSLITESREDVWDGHGVAEDLWRRIPKDDLLECAFIQALLRHGAINRAFQHYESMISDHKVVDLPTFNALLTCHNDIQVDQDAKDKISSPPSSSTSQSQRSPYVFENILRTMSARGILPTTATFNAVLYGLTDRRLNGRHQLAEATLIEMMDIGLRPTLATFTHLIKTWRGQDIERRLDWILKVVESSPDMTSFSMGEGESVNEDPNDVHFFIVAIAAVRSAAGRPELAHRIHALTHRPEYRNLLFKDMNLFNDFFTSYVNLLLEGGYLSEAMDIFATYVPNMLRVSLYFLRAFMNLLLAFQPLSTQHLVTIGNELTSPGALRDDGVSDNFTVLLVSTAANESMAANKSAVAALAINYFELYARAKELQLGRKSNTLKPFGPEPPANDWSLSSAACDNLILCLCHAGFLDDAIRVFEGYLKERDNLAGAPPVEGAAFLTRLVATSSSMSPMRKGDLIVRVLQFFDEIGAKWHLEKGLDLMLEEVPLDTNTALVAAELKQELVRGGSGREEANRSQRQ